MRCRYDTIKRSFAITQTDPSQTPENKTQVEFYYLSWDVDMIQLKSSFEITQTGPSQTPANKTEVDFYYLSWDVDVIH